MKEFEPGALAIVRRLTEANDDFEDSWKDTMDLDQENFWYQISGDVNAWQYGGTWFNPKLNDIVHFYGLDDENNKDIDYREIEVPENVMAKIKARIHDPYLDTPEAQEDPEWVRKHLFSEEMEMDRIIDSYKIARAEFLNRRKPRTFYRTNIGSDLPPRWRKYELKNPNGLDDETWKGMSLANKIDELIGYFGWDEYASSFQMTYKEAQELLGKDNI